MQSVPNSQSVKIDRNVLIVVAAVVIGGIVFQTLPAPRAKPERPVLKFLAKVAKLGLWVLMAQSAPIPHIYAAEHGHQVDAAGHRDLQSGEGW
jgi:hypothetical protein